MKYRRLPIPALLLTCLIVSGCEPDLRPGRDCNPRSTWGSSRYSSAESHWLYLNFYEYHEKYPEYGIAVYTHDSARDGDFTSEDLIADSLRRVREEYSTAYSNGQIVRWDSSQNLEVPLDISNIVILLDDRNPKQGSGPQVGSVFRVADVFAAAQTPRSLVEQSVIERGVLHKDDLVSAEDERNGYSPKEKVRFQIIERHME